MEQALFPYVNQTWIRFCGEKTTVHVLSSEGNVSWWVSNWQLTGYELDTLPTAPLLVYTTCTYSGNLEFKCSQNISFGADKGM